MKLGDILQIRETLTKIKAIELKDFHKILYNRTGEKHQIKKHIFEFSGFVFEDENEKQKKIDQIARFKSSILKDVSGYCGLFRSGTKDDLVVSSYFICFIYYIYYIVS